jgi:hypothetical protein
MSENRVLRKIFGPKREEVVRGGWRNYILMSFLTWSLHQTFYYGDQIKTHEMGETYSKHGEMTTAHKILVGKPKGKRPLGRNRSR